MRARPGDSKTPVIAGKGEEITTAYNLLGTFLTKIPLCSTIKSYGEKENYQVFRDHEGNIEIRCPLHGSARELQIAIQDAIAREQSIIHKFPLFDIIFLLCIVIRFTLGKKLFKPIVDKKWHKRILISLKRIFLVIDIPEDRKLLHVLVLYLTNIVFGITFIALLTKFFFPPVNPAFGLETIVEYIANTYPEKVPESTFETILTLTILMILRIVFLYFVCFVLYNCYLFFRSCVIELAKKREV